MVDHLVEQRQARLEGLLAILVEEEFGIGQARPHDALVALDHGTGVVGADVADDEELVGQRAGAVEQREVLLVRLHRQDQALGRHGQELGLEAAQQDVRALDQGRHFVEQRVVFDRGQTLRVRGMLELAHDLGAAVCKSGHHRALGFQLVGVMVGVLQHHRRHLRFEAVPLRRAARLEAERGHRDDLGAMQRHQAMHRTHEVHARPAVAELVAHQLRDRQSCDRVLERAL